MGTRARAALWLRGRALRGARRREAATGSQRSRCLRRHNEGWGGAGHSLEIWRHPAKRRRSRTRGHGEAQGRERRKTHARRGDAPRQGRGVCRDKVAGVRGTGRAGARHAAPRHSAAPAPRHAAPFPGGSPRTMAISTARCSPRCSASRQKAGILSRGELREEEAPATRRPDSPPAYSVYFSKKTLMCSFPVSVWPVLS